MKLSLAVLVVLTVTRTFEINASPIAATYNLKDDLNDFLALVPAEEIKELLFQYLAEDEEFAEALDYVLSDEFKSLLTEIEAQPEVKSLLKFLQDSGLDAYGFVNQVHKLLGMEPIKPLNINRLNKITGGLTGFIHDVIALLPMDKIEKLYQEKLHSSKDFAALIQRLQSKEFQSLIDRLMANANLQDLLKRAEAKGVDVQAIFDFLTTLLGLKFPARPLMRVARNLKDDLNDFLALVPIDKIKELFFQYLNEDEEFGETIEYLMSDDFKDLVKEVEAQPEVKSLFKFLHESGLDVYGFINKLHKLLGMEPIKPLNVNKLSKITGGLSGFIKDVVALLPMDKIEKLYQEKLHSSKDFTALIHRLQSKEFQGLIDKLMASKNVQALLKRAESKGVDVQAIFDFFTKLLGLKFPARPLMRVARNLKDDLNDFLALVPIDKIKELFFQYLNEDEEFGETIEYLMSDDFKGLVKEVEAQPEVKSLFKFLHESGLDVYGFINKLHKLLGMEPIKPLNVNKLSKITGGLSGFIKDVVALLPMDKIEKLYQEKLHSSKDFTALIHRLQSKEFQGLIDRLLASKNVQALLKRAESKGVDVQAIFDFFTKLLGLKFPARPTTFKEEEVIDIFRQIWGKVPVDEIMDLIVDYLLHDEDFKRVVKYMMNDDFKKILDEIEELKEMKVLFKYLTGVPMDVYKWINQFHELIGLQKTLPTTYRKITGGVPGLMKDIRALLPLDDLYKIYDEKLESSKKFRDFIHKLEHPILQDCVDALDHHQGFQVWLTKLENLGVNWNEVTEIISAIIGIKFPQRPFY